MHKSNCFITLTYDNENLKSRKLVYKDFQGFVKKLRNHLYGELLGELFPSFPQKEQRSLWRKLPKERRDELYGKIKIGVFGVGEYGDKGKRPHWHALVFNWRPVDATHKYTSKRGDRVYHSKILEELWGRGIAEFGEVTFHSAGYCARYAAKKLVHGDDGHEFEPIARRSCKQAIGKSWIEKYWKDVFNYGYVVLPGGERCGVPRYYEKWLRVHHPAAWENYLTKVKARIISEAIQKEEKVTLEEKLANLKRSAEYGYKMLPIKTRKESEAIILESKFNQLQKNLKL